MKDYSRETIIDIIKHGDATNLEAFKMGTYINEIMEDEEKFEKACTDPEFMPITITIGKETFHFEWMASVVNALGEACEYIVEEY